MLLRLIEAACIASSRRYRPVLSEMEGGAVADTMDELHHTDMAAWRAARRHYHHTRPEPVSIFRRRADARRLAWLPAFRLAWTRLAGR